MIDQSFFIKCQRCNSPYEIEFIKEKNELVKLLCPYCQYNKYFKLEKFIEKYKTKDEGKNSIPDKYFKNNYSCGHINQVYVYFCYNCKKHLCRQCYKNHDKNHQYKSLVNENILENQIALEEKIEASKKFIYEITKEKKDKLILILKNKANELEETYQKYCEINQKFLDYVKILIINSNIDFPNYYSQKNLYKNINFYFFDQSGFPNSTAEERKFSSDQKAINYFIYNLKNVNIIITKEKDLEDITKMKNKINLCELNHTIRKIELVSDNILVLAFRLKIDFVRLDFDQLIFKESIDLRSFFIDFSFDEESKNIYCLTNSDQLLIHKLNDYNSTNSYINLFENFNKILLTTDYIVLANQNKILVMRKNNLQKILFEFYLQGSHYGKMECEPNTLYFIDNNFLINFYDINKKKLIDYSFQIKNPKVNYVDCLPFGKEKLIISNDKLFIILNYITRQIESNILFEHMPYDYNNIRDNNFLFNAGNFNNNNIFNNYNNNFNNNYNNNINNNLNSSRLLKLSDCCYIYVYNNKPYQISTKLNTVTSVNLQNLSLITQYSSDMFICVCEKASVYLYRLNNSF